MEKKFLDLWRSSDLSDIATVHHGLLVSYLCTAYKGIESDFFNDFMSTIINAYETKQVVHKSLAPVLVRHKLEILTRINACIKQTEDLLRSLSTVHALRRYVEINQYIVESLKSEVQTLFARDDFNPCIAITFLEMGLNLRNSTLNGALK